MGLVSLTDGTSGPWPDCRKGTGAGRIRWRSNFNHDVRNSSQHSHLVHFTVWRKYWEMRQCVATQVSLLEPGPMPNLRHTRSQQEIYQGQVHSKFLPKAFQRLTSSTSVVLLCESKWMPKVSWVRRTPASALLRGAILLSTLLYADILGARVDTNITSKLNSLKCWIETSKVLGNRGFSSGPPSHNIIAIGLVTSSTFTSSWNSFISITWLKSFPREYAVLESCFPLLRAT